MRVVAVIGQGEPDDGRVCELAAAVGAGLARRGATVVTGGLGGVMAAASAGARREGGRVIAILPGDDPGGVRADADVVVATATGEARDLAVVASAEGVVAVGAGWGTLAEIGLARKLGRPVVLLESWEVRAPGGAAPDGVRFADSPQEAVAAILERA